MQFVLDDGVYKVARITGSTYNFLGIRISNTEEEIKVVPLNKSGEVAGIDERDVVRQVRSGLALVNQELSRRYSVSEVQFVTSDTYSPDVYVNLTIELIKRIDSGAQFEPTRFSGQPN
jgi:hypothetical protein